MGGGVLPIMAYTGRLRPKGVPFSAFEVCKRVGISQAEVHKRVGKSVTEVFKRAFNYNILNRHPLRLYKFIYYVLHENENNTS